MATPDHRLDGAISDEVRRWLRVDEVGRITRAKGVTSTSAIPIVPGDQEFGAALQNHARDACPHAYDPRFDGSRGTPGKPTAAAARPACRNPGVG